MAQRTQSSNVYPAVNSSMLLELNSRIEQLNRSRSQLEDDATDLEDSIKLNIQASGILTQEFPRRIPQQVDKLSRLTALIAQNDRLINEIRLERQEKQAAVAEVTKSTTQALIHNQVLVEEEIFFTERLLSNQQRLDELRRLMHDKEFSYSNLVDNLSEYEEVPECEFPSTLPNIDYALHDNANKKVMAKLSHDKQELSEQKRGMLQQSIYIKKAVRKVLESILGGTDYHKIVSMIKESDDLRSEGHEKLGQEQRLRNDALEQGSPLHLSAMHTPLRSVHRELMVLLKREVRARELISLEFKESFEIGEEVKERNQQLQQSNHTQLQLLESYKKQVRSLEGRIKYYGNRLKHTEEEEVRFEEKAKEPNSSLIEGLEQRSDLNKHVFNNALIIKCGSEPDCSRQSPNHCSTADFD